MLILYCFSECGETEIAGVPVVTALGRQRWEDCQRSSPAWYTHWVPGHLLRPSLKSNQSK